MVLKQNIMKIINLQNKYLLKATVYTIRLKRVISTAICKDTVTEWQLDFNSVGTNMYTQSLHLQFFFISSYTTTKNNKV